MLMEEIEKTYALLERRFTPGDMLHFITTPESELYLYDFSLGSWIRQNLLMTGSDLFCSFCRRGYYDTHAMMQIIVLMFHRHKRWNMSRRG